MKRLSVLVADDNSDAADTLALLIELAGHDVTVRYDGSSALTAAESKHFDAAILDLAMPLLDGYECGRQMKLKSPQTTLIALSGHAALAHRYLTRDAGFKFHYAKPLGGGDLEELLSCLERGA
jgi:CheY-like chemotaxis protein